MGRVFIADPALKNFQGHHYSVTLAFANELIRSGHNVSVLGHVELSGNLDILPGVDVHPVFEIDSYSLHRKSVKKSSISSENSSGNFKQTFFELKSYKDLFKSFKPWLRPIYMTLLSETKRIKLKTLLKRRLKNSHLKMKEASSKQLDCPKGSILSAFRKAKVSKYDVVFFHTCDAVTYFDILNLFIRDTPVSLWGIRPKLILSTPYDDVVMPHNKWPDSADASVRRLSKLGLINEKIFLFAENKPLSIDLTKYFGSSVSPLYVPFPAISHQDASERNKNETVFSYLGAARTEKGFVKVAEAVIEFLSLEKRQDVKFFLQASPQILGYTPDIEKIVRMLKEVSDDRLIVTFAAQTPEEYNQWIIDTDCFFICYDVNRYKSRSSGVAVEALVHGKNAIVSTATFPAYLFGDAGLSVRSSSDICTAIAYYLENKTHFSYESAKRTRWFEKECEASNLSNIIMSINTFVSAEDNMLIEHESSNLKSLKYRNLI